MFIEDYSKIELLEDGKVYTSVAREQLNGSWGYQKTLKKGSILRLSMRGKTLCFKVKNLSLDEYDYYHLRCAKFKYRYV
jgi:hypothetical protein